MRRNRKKRHSEEIGEPEILPMMNVLFMLVMVLMGMSAFLPLGVITTEAPRLSSGQAVASPKQQGLDLRIMLLKTGINLSVNRATLKGALGPLIPKVEVNGHQIYNFEALQQKLSEIKAQHPKETNVMIMADPDVIYDDIVHTMDAARQSNDGKLLFPEVAFIPGVVR